MLLSCQVSKFDDRHAMTIGLVAKAFDEGSPCGAQKLLLRV